MRGESGTGQIAHEASTITAIRDNEVHHEWVSEGSLEKGGQEKRQCLDTLAHSPADPSLSQCLAGNGEVLSAKG